MGSGNGIKQVWIPYWKWECHKSGMWSKVDNESQLLKKAIEFTGNHSLYGEWMRVVVWEWKFTMINHLTNKSINRRAFLGHCAVCYKLGIPEYITRKAWKHLTNEQRRLADLEAENTIKEWELWYMTKSKNMLNNGRKDVIQKEYQMKLPLKFEIKSPVISK